MFSRRSHFGLLIALRSETDYRLIHGQNPLELLVKMSTELGLQIEMSSVKHGPREPRHFQFLANRLQPACRDILGVDWSAGARSKNEILKSGKSPAILEVAQN